MMRSPLARLLLIGVAFALVAACPHSEPPPDPLDAGIDEPDAGVDMPDAGVDMPDAGVTCTLQPPTEPAVPWRESCAQAPAVDPCWQVEFPDAGPVPPADRWCEDSARIRCAAWVDAGTVDPTAEAECMQLESKRCASRFPASYVDAGVLTYWPAAAWECLQGPRRRDSPACGCAFAPPRPEAPAGAPCTSNLSCLSRYCLKDASDAGTCVECPPLHPVGSACGQGAGDAPCDSAGQCIKGCCVRRPTTGQSCGGLPYRYCNPDTSTCSDTCIETCAGGTCDAYKEVGEECGLAPDCGGRPQQLCNLGICAKGLVCTYMSSDLTKPAQCQPTGVRCAGNRLGCGPGQECTAAPGRCFVPYSSQVGEPCEGARQCAEGLVCRRADAGSSGVCSAGEPGECGLGFDSECPWEQQCINGRCTTPPPLGAPCGSVSACGRYLLCAKDSEDGGSCAPLARRGDRCIFTAPDGGFPHWIYGCLEGTCNSRSHLCE